MSWEEREYSEDPWRKMGRPGGDWKGLRPTFDNPMTWSIPVGRVSGITVRIHVLFLVFLVVELAKATGLASKSASAPMVMEITLIWLGALWLTVLMHEFGHCIACRLTGGTANEILMWPLGGLAFCLPPHRWKAHFITVAGGPLVNVLFLVITVPVLGLITGHWWGVAIPSPFSLEGMYDLKVQRSILMMILFGLTQVNMLLLAFNLLPVFPFDGGRMLQALLWPKLGYSRSMRVAVRVGYVGAILMIVLGMVLENGWLIALAVFGGITCYITYKQVEFTDQTMGFEDDEYALSLSYGQADADESQPRKPAQSARQLKAAAREAQREQEEAAEVDRILQKIADTGLNSLSRSEKKLLEQATERKRQQNS